MENTRQELQKIVRVAQKAKDPKQLQQKYKTQEGEILTYTLHTAWVQTTGKRTRLLRYSGFAFVPNPKTYGICRPTQL